MSRAYSSWDAFAAGVRDAVGQGFDRAAAEARRHEETKYQRMRALQQDGDAPGVLIEGRCVDVTEGGAV